MKNLLFMSLYLCFWAATSAQMPKKSFISFKKVESELKRQGYVFSSPYNNQGQMRISSVDQSLGRSVYIYYKQDTVTEIKLNIRIKTNSEKLSNHFDVFLPVIRVIDPEGESWIKQELSHHNAKQPLEMKKAINKEYYVLNYYPDLEGALLNIGIFNEDPGF